MTLCFENYLADNRKLRNQTYVYIDTETIWAESFDFFPQEGAFLVRDCSKNTTYEPLVLAVFYDKRVFNIQIRFSEEISKYTLGTGLRTNDVSSCRTQCYDGADTVHHLSCLVSFRGSIRSLTSSSSTPFSPSFSLTDAKLLQRPIRRDSVSWCTQSQSRTWRSCWLEQIHHTAMSTGLLTDLLTL